MKTFRIEQQNVEQAWPLVQPYIARAVVENQGEYDEADVYRDLTNGVSQLWLGCNDELKLRMVLVSRIEIWPKAKWLRILLVAGEGLDEHYGNLESIESWAKALGCTDTVAAVRPGLRKRLLKEAGFKLDYESVSRRIA